jgi:hypothetical protein
VSNLNAFRDGRRVLQTILAERHRPQPSSVLEVTEQQPPVAQALCESSSSSALTGSEEQPIEVLVTGGESGDRAV